MSIIFWGKTEWHFIFKCVFRLYLSLAKRLTECDQLRICTHITFIGYRRNGMSVLSIHLLVKIHFDYPQDAMNTYHVHNLFSRISIAHRRGRERKIDFMSGNSCEAFLVS